MSQKLITKQKDGDNRLRFYVLPIESEAGFRDLMKFIAEELELDLGVLDEGPGTLLQKGLHKGSQITFVFSDSTGAQFYADNQEDVGIAEEIANSVEARLREVMG